MSRFVCIIWILSAPTWAKPWNAIEPGVATAADVVAKFGQPSKMIAADGQEILVYGAKNAISGTVQAQFKVDQLLKVVDRIDVYPAPIVDVDEIERSYGRACAVTRAAEPCYVRQMATSKRKYFLYVKLGLAIFFEDDGRRVRAFSFLRAM